MTTRAHNPELKESRFRIPSLFEIFWGKLANWFRKLAQWRKQGLLKKALQAARRRNAMRLEALEPRVLLSADLIYGADPGDAGVTDFTLVAEDNSGNLFVKLYETANMTNEIGSIQIDDPSELELDIKRFGGDVAGAASGDRLRIDMDTLSALGGYVSANGNLLTLNFDGGNELVADDHVNVEGTGSYSIGYGLSITSTSDIIVGLGSVTLDGEFSLHSEDEISVLSSTIDAQTHNITLTANSSSNGIFGVGIFGPGNALITIDDSDFHGNAIDIEATSAVTLTPNSIGGSVVRVAVAVATSDAEVSIINGSTITATGNLTISASSQVNATAEILPDGTDATQ